MKLMKFALLLAPALLLSAPVLAGDAPQGKDRQAHHARHDRGADSTADGMLRVMRAFHRLDLDEAQQAELSTLAETVKADLKANRVASHENRKALHELLRSGAMDEDGLAAIAEEEGRLTSERVLIAGTALSHGLALLEDSQREQLHELMQEHRHRMAHQRKRGPKDES